VAFSGEYLSPINKDAFKDSRVSFHYGDGRAFAEKAAGTSCYDIIIMDMTDPDGPASMLYTAEFFAAIKKLFRDSRAVFSMHGESPIAWPQAFACIGATLSEVFANVSVSTCYVPMYGTLWSFRYASDSAVPALSSLDAIGKRLDENNILPQLVNKSMWTALFAPDPAIAEAESHPCRRIIRDSDPVFPGIFDV
jgi:spermidine synthase